MSSELTSNNEWVTKFYKVIMPKIYGIGAAIVIAGAMFKLLNWPGGALMLGLGLTTEAIIFFLSAFEPQPEEVDWSKVYPELRTDQPGLVAPRTQPIDSLGDKLDELFSQAQIDKALVERLGQGMSQLADSVAHMAHLPQIGEATQKYAGHVEKASSVLESIYEAHTNVLGAVNNLADVSQNAQHYNEQIQNLTGTLQAVNENYQKELQATQLYFGQSKEIFVGVSASITKLQEASEETETFKNELFRLNEKMASLNNVYGNMLTALKS